jgi:hypothetical protein
MMNSQFYLAINTAAIKVRRASQALKTDTVVVSLSVPPDQVIPHFFCFFFVKQTNHNLCPEFLKYRANKPSVESRLPH